MLVRLLSKLTELPIKKALLQLLSYFKPNSPPNEIWGSVCSPEPPQGIELNGTIMFYTSVRLRFRRIGLILKKGDES